MIRTVRKNGNSFYITIEKKEAKFLNLVVGDAVHVLVTKIKDES